MDVKLESSIYKMGQDKQEEVREDVYYSIINRCFMMPSMCVVGDSKTAKAELLMIGSGFCPHAVYNSGKVASDAGLTAADLRDG